MLLILSLLGFLNPKNENFTKLICEYKSEELSISLTKKELIEGFKKIDEIECLDKLNLQNFWITLIRNGNTSNTTIIKFENRGDIPKLLEDIQKGIQLISPYLSRRIICKDEIK